MKQGKLLFLFRFEVSDSLHFTRVFLKVKNSGFCSVPLCRPALLVSCKPVRLALATVLVGQFMHWETAIRLLESENVPAGQSVHELAEVPE